MAVLAVVALSARMLAEAARDDGFDVVALDLFGDADTRRACAQWLPIGAAGALRIDAAELLPALAALARRGDVTGWIAGSGFEGQTGLLERGAALLPLIGTPASVVRRVRDPKDFFGVLDAHAIAHPAVQMTEPADPAGWLEKDAQGCGGWHIRRASKRAARGAAHAGAHRYFQRETTGTPMSATFIANGADACVLGFNRLIVRRFGTRPFVFRGAVGPVALPDAVAHRVDSAVRTLSAAFSLRGLASLDFMLQGDTFEVLEINPRPPASMALYAGRAVVAAHLRACLEGGLPARGTAAANAPVGGHETVFATRPFQLDEARARHLAERGACHDLPTAATRFEIGDPVCSVSARGADATQVLALLERGREAVHLLLETPA